MKLTALSQTQSANLAAMLTGVTSSVTENKVQEMNGAAFSQVLNGTCERDVTSSDSNAGHEDVFRVEKSSESVAGDVIERSKDVPANEKITKSQENLEEESEVVAEAAATFVNQTTQAICEALGIDEEQLVNAMEELGIGFMDLLQPQNLNNLVAQLSGIQDQMNLVLDENVSNLLLEVNRFAQDFMQTTQGMVIPQDIMQVMATDFENGEIPFELQMDSQTMEQNLMQTDALVTPAGDATNQQVVDEVEQMVVQSATQKGTNNLTQTTGEDNAQALQNQQVNDDTNSEQKGSAQADTNANYFEQSQDEEATFNYSNAAENQSTQNAQTTTNQFAAQVQTAQTVSYASEVSYAQEVLEQVTEFVSTNVTADTSSIEMSLTPETLGKLYIKVAQVEGQITATITATTEIARQALASQVYTLKEALNLQGIKVEAVEVSVATHEFERNLEENANSKQQEQMGEQQEKVSQGRRRSLNLTQEGEMPENLTEAEQLAATIMKDNGNSVDLTA